MRIAYFSSFLLFSNQIFAKFVNFEEASTFLRSKRSAEVQFNSKEAKECFTENEKCGYEEFAEKAENEFGKPVFGLKNWRRKRTSINEVTSEFFEKNYDECESTELNAGCKIRMIKYLNCAKTGTERSCYDMHKKQAAPVTEKVETAQVEIVPEVNAAPVAENSRRMPSSRSNSRNTGGSWRAKEGLTQSPFKFLDDSNY